MAIADIEEFAHLTDADIEALAVELDALRAEVEESLGERDARYIRRTIAAQRGLEVAGRLLLAFGSRCAARSSRTWRSATTCCTASGTG